VEKEGSVREALTVHEDVPACYASPLAVDQNGNIEVIVDSEVSAEAIASTFFNILCCSKSLAHVVWLERYLEGLEGAKAAGSLCRTFMRRGSERMYRILISESAYTIWKLRNDRVINRAGSPINEVESIKKWTHNLNQRLQQDILLANRPTGRNCPRIPPTLVKGHGPEPWRTRVICQKTG
jgi:hypothetical protein